MSRVSPSLFAVFFVLVFAFVLVLVLVPPGDNDPTPNLKTAAHVARMMLATTRPSPDVLPRSSAGYMRSRTLPQTKSKSKPMSKLKRKSASEDKPKPSRASKPSRKNSTPRPASSPRDLALEPAYGLLSDVPQSMLFCFQVIPLPSQVCDAETESSVVSDTASLHVEKFASIGPEPMFDHSWRIAFVEARIPVEDYGLSRFASDETACAHTDVLGQRSDVPPSGALVSVSPLSASLSSPSVLSSGRYPESPGGDGSPSSLARGIRLVDTSRSPGYNNEITRDQNPSHLRPPVLTQPNLSRVVDDQDSMASPECYSTPPIPNEPASDLLHHASGPQHWPPSHAPPFVSSFHLPAPSSSALSSSLFPISSSFPSLTSCDPGSTTSYSQLRNSAPPLQDPPLERVSQPPVTTLPHEERHRDTMARSLVNLRLPPPPPLTSFPIHPSFPPPGFPPGPWVSDHSVPHFTVKAPIAPVTHPHAFGMPNVFNVPPGQRFPYPAHHSLPNAPMSPMPLPVLQPTPCVPAPWCTLFDNLKKRTQTDPGPAKKKRRTSALTPEELGHDAGQPNLNDADGNEHEARVHPCPLCPRVFSLPNSLALHLKWHWGASGLEWKRGINPKNKWLGRMVRQTDEHRYRAPVARMEQIEAGVSVDYPPATSGIRGANGRPSPPPIDDGNRAALGHVHFNPHVSWNVVDNPYCPSSEASTSTSKLGESPGLPPFDPGRSFQLPRLPPLGELALPQLPMDTAPEAHPFGSRFTIPEGLFPTETGPAHDNALQGGMSNHTGQWSHNWFGYDGLAEQGGSSNAAAEGEEGLDALLGDSHTHIEVSTHRRVDGQRTTQGNAGPTCTERSV